MGCLFGVRRIIAGVGIVLAVLAAWPVTPAYSIVKEENEDPVERCKRKCDEEYEARGKKCNRKKDAKKKRLCWEDNMRIYKQCLRDCEKKS